MNYNKGIYVKPAMCSYFKIPFSRNINIVKPNTAKGATGLTFFI